MEGYQVTGEEGTYNNGFSHDYMEFCLQLDIKYQRCNWLHIFKYTSQQSSFSYLLLQVTKC